MKRFFLLLFIFRAYIALAQEVIPVDMELPNVLFTNVEIIQSGEKDTTLFQTINDLIKAIPPGEEITISIFKFDYKGIARNLVEAQSRGVKVRVIMNKGETSKKDNKDIKEYFKETLNDFHFVENTISNKAIIHNKFILFSGVETKSGVVPHVILQTSSNFQEKSSEKLQDMIIFRDEDIYYGYLDFWYNIKVLGNVGALESFNYFDIENDGPNLKTYFFPKRKNEEEKGQDDIVKILKAIDKPDEAHIRFAHGKWTEDREDVLSTLRELHDKGAKIEIVTNESSEIDILNDFVQENASITILPDQINLHTKFFLTDADFGKGRKQIVWTGSHNMTERSLRNNFEVLLAIMNHDIYREYLAYFKSIQELD